MSKTKTKLVRMNEKENERLENEAARLGLTAGELLRRALRVALPIFEKTKAPGAVPPRNRWHREVSND